MSSKSVDAVKGAEVQARGMVPKLRFPEFQEAGDWAYRPLGALANILDERVGSNTYIPYSITSGVGLVSQQEKFGRTIAGSQLKNYFVLQPQDFAYNKSATKEYPQGFAVMFEGDAPGCVPASIFTCFRIHDSSVSAEYLNFLLRGNLHGRWLANYSAVGARANGSLAIDDKDLLALPVPLPAGNTSTTEQQKIADCLSSLDAVIAAEGDRLAALKDHKKGLMQHLFPAKDQTSPRLRFPEFEGTGDWEVKPLSHCIKLISGLHLSPDEYNSSGELPYFSGPSDITNEISQVSKWTYKTANAAQSDDILLVVKGSGVGDFWRLLLPSVAIGRQLMAIRTTTGSSEFVYQSLAMKAAQLKSRATGNLIPGLSRPDILEMMFMFPPEEAEQEKIAKCLSELDAAIAAKMDSLAALKTHKKALMQQLFPAPAQATA